MEGATSPPVAGIHHIAASRGDARRDVELRVEAVG